MSAGTKNASDSTTAAGSARWKIEAPPLALGLTILWHPNPARAGERAPLDGLASGGEELLSRIVPAFSPLAERRLLPLGDVHLSREPLRFVRGKEPGAVRLMVGGTRTRVVTGGQAITDAREFSAAEIARGVVLLLSECIALVLHTYDPLGGLGLSSFGLVGESAAMIQLRREIRQVADVDVPLLLHGESGTGKELVAQAVHQASPRRDKPYLAVNLGAIPPTLAAAELFGTTKGAFTGADRSRAGYFARADGGTLFLDEIGEAPQEVQVLLLRAFETGEIQPVGADRAQRVDVRLVTATDADLFAAAAAGQFRTPLLHRLGSYVIELPPLRSRREDFGRLFAHLLRQELEALGMARRLAAPPPGSRPWLPAPLVARLAEHEWPGNVRQLRNVARRIAILGRDDVHIRTDTQIEKLLGAAGEKAAPERARPSPPPPPRPFYRSPKDVTDDELVDALRANQWRLQPTAAQLGISRSSLYDLIDRSGAIRKASDLPRPEVEAAVRRCGSDLDAMVESLEVSKKGLARRLKELGLL